MNKINKRFIGFCLLIFIFAFSAQAQDSIGGVVRLSVVSMRSKPSFPAEIGTQALMGTPVKVLEINRGWINIMTPDGYSGWVIDDGIQQMKAEAYKRWVAAPKMIVTNYFTVVRESPSANAPVVSDIVWGDILRYMGTQGRFYKVATPDGRMAYVLKCDAMPLNEWIATRQPTAEKILATAKKLIGLPYFWGGTSIKGVDCSGFTKTSYFLNGIILRRNASEQAQTGEVVDITKGLENLQPADLLFFGSVVDGKDKVTHVGLYMGNGEFIHSSGLVHISSLVPQAPRYDSYNAKRLLCARRILTRVNKEPGIMTLDQHPFYQ